MATAVSSGMAGALLEAADSSWIKMLPTCGPLPWAMIISYFEDKLAIISPTFEATFFWASAVTSPFCWRALPPSAITTRVFIYIIIT